MRRFDVMANRKPLPKAIHEVQYAPIDRVWGTRAFRLASLSCCSLTFSRRIDGGDLGMGRRRSAYNPRLHLCKVVRELFIGYALKERC